MFLADPGDSDDENWVHKQLTDSAISYRSARDFILRTASQSRSTPGKSRSVIDRHDFLADRLADVFAQWTIETIVFELLKDVCAPAGAARNREYWGKQIGRNS